MPHSRNGAACRTPNLMEEFSRPATLEDLKLLLRSLNEHSVDYLLIGGYALAAHGYQRATIDIDLLVPGNAASGQRIKDALMVLPDQAANDRSGTTTKQAAKPHFRTHVKEKGTRRCLFHLYQAKIRQQPAP